MSEVRAEKAGDCCSPGMDHIYTMLKSNADDVVLGKVGCDGGEAFANLVRLVGLSERRRNMMASMCAHCWTVYLR